MHAPHLAVATVLLACALMLMACGGTAPVQAPVKVADPERAPPPAPPPDGTGDAALLDRLQHESLSGFVMAPLDAVLFPSLEAARNGSRSAPAGARPDHRSSRYVIMRDRLHEQRSASSALRVLEDHGDVVKVSTDMGPDDIPLPVLDPSYRLEAFIRRDALLPVLRQGKLESFDDGTAVALRAGLIVTLAEDGVHPAHPGLAKVPLELASDDVALSFALPDKDIELPAVVGTEMGCERIVGSLLSNDDERTHVAAAEVLRREQTEKYQREHPQSHDWGGMGFGMGGYADQPSCTLSGRYAPRGDEPPPLRMNGIAFAQSHDVAGDPCFDSVSVHRGPHGLLARIELPRASVRALVDEHALRKAGGCGAAGFLGHPYPKVWAVDGDVAAYFADGSRAGSHHGGKTRLRDGHAVGERICFALSYLSVELCHYRADLVEIEDTPY